jgi:copper chaperone NosL
MLILFGFFVHKRISVEENQNIKEGVMKNSKTSLLIGFSVSIFLLLGSALFAQTDMDEHKSCGYCGMDRQKFAHSRMLVEYDDGKLIGTCSIHCIAVDLALNIDKTPKTLQVGDYYTKNLIDAEKAFWVVGGSKMGVMTGRAKWAFEKKDEAEKFVKENGGGIATFDEAMKAAYEDMYADTKMIRDRRKMMKQKTMEKKHP